MHCIEQAWELSCSMRIMFRRTVQHKASLIFYVNYFQGLSIIDHASHPPQCVGHNDNLTSDMLTTLTSSNSIN